MPREEKIKILSRCLSTIGQRIDEAVKQHREVPKLSKEKQKKHLWKVTAGFWPTEGVDYQKIQSMYVKIAAAAAAKKK